ncbi:MAG: DUF3429 domain-containing protein [Alphaproteobacteria bacterium]|nr:DUF3429 domain-containing protein [Alphaproteobacteria bacterium]
MTNATLADVPFPARVLGLGGVIPFAGCAAVFWALFDSAPFWAWKAFEAQLFYGVVILSFLGAVHWGSVLAAREEAEQIWFRLGWSVMPALLAWLAALMNPLPAVLTLVVGVTAAYFMDLRARDQGWFPRWYLALRKILTLLVIASLAASLVRLVV